VVGELVSVDTEVAVVVSGEMCGIGKMGKFPEHLIFNMGETDFTGSGCHPLCFRPSSRH
jgi:hypothetical protein